MSNNKGLVIGENLRLEHDFESLTVIGKSDATFTEDDEGKIFLGSSAVFKPTGEMEGTVSPNGITISSGDTTTAANKHYYCDATAGAFTLALTGALKEYIAVKKDATANVVTLQPTSGLINGGPSFPLTTQFQKVTIIFDGTDFYV